MRLAVFSDVHGNLPALEAVLGDIHDAGATHVVCLGDLVDYGPFPNEVIDRVRHDGIPIIIGNHDDGVGFDRTDSGGGFKDLREKNRKDRAFAWTKAHVTAESKAFLRELPHEMRVEAGNGQLLLVHASPRSLNEYVYADRPASTFQAIAEAAGSRTVAIAFGHTHKPYTRTVAGMLFVNAGSVGNPKDGDPRACYAVLYAFTVAVVW